ncbi:hypothetical protein D3C74_244540 [compost metagenome]
MRGETSRTINKQYLTLQQFCFDYQLPYGDVIVLKEIAKSDAPRPKLEPILNGSMKIDVLVVQSHHMLHIYHDRFLQILEQLSKNEIALLILNEQVDGDSL